ncbi:MAG: SusC/RagA family TonB-linked outer membrane protein, partial [Tannerellaceae bacterium]
SKATLEISYIGYLSQHINGTVQSPVRIVLTENNQTLDEVVVIGFGSTKKVNLTGAVSNVKMDDVLGNRPVNSALTALEGAIPGLQINKNSGKPGVSINTNIRGVTSINGGGPLVLVDNVPMDLNLVDPNDIESVSVLKDAAASAIYGARAAFGVILVTTKQGKKETPVKIAYGNNFSFSTVSEKLKKVSPKQTLRYFDDLGIKTYYSGQVIDTWKDLLNAYENEGKYPEGFAWGDDGYRYNLAPTDVYSDMLDPFGFQQQHNISVSGGSTKTTYRASLGSVNEDGILVGNKDTYARYNASVFLSMDGPSWITAQADVKYTNVKTSTATGQAGNTNIWGNINEAMAMAPLGMGTITKDGETEYYFSSPRHAIQLHEPDINRNSNIRLLGRFIIKPLKGWNITGEYTYNRNWTSTRKIRKTVETLDPYDMQLKIVNASNSYEMTNTFDNRNILNLFSTYEHSFGSHDLSLMAGFNQEAYHYESLYGKRRDLINQELPSLGQASGEMQTTDSFNELALRSLFYRFNYAYKERYLFEANGRYDGSSRFPKKDRFGFFPSFSAAWRISEEAFWNSAKDIISNLKLRASWGNIGNQNVGGYYPYLSTMDTSKPTWVIPGQKDWVTSLKIPALVSGSFTWETINTTDIGLDVLLLDKLSISADYYIRNTNNMLAFSTPLPSILGAPAPKGNVAALKTKGWEVSLTWKDRIGSDFNYSASLNLYDSKSEITDYYNPTGLLTSDNKLALRNGMKYGEIWGYETDRFLNDDDFNPDGSVKKEIALLQNQKNVYPGDILYKDQNGDGFISVGDNTETNPGDQVVIGNSSFRFQYGITGSMQYKNIDCSFLFTGVGKRDLWINLFPHQGEYVKGIDTYMTDHWTPENPNAFYPRISAKNPTAGNTQRQSKYLSDASYLRLKNITIGYNIPKNTCEKLYISSLRIFVSGENLLTFHHLPKGYMPDAFDTSVGGLNINSSPVGDSYSGNITYPLMRQFSFGVNLSF